MFSILTSIYFTWSLLAISVALSVMLILFFRRGWHKEGPAAYCFLALMACNLLMYALSFVVYMLGQYVFNLLMAYAYVIAEKGDMGFPI